MKKETKETFSAFFIVLALLVIAIYILDSV